MTSSKPAALPFDLVDVFAEQALAGNPLAVVRVETMPSAAFRQAFARETNLSETSFVATRPDAAGHWPVRIHTPALELPFAGHPTLGTAWVVAARLGGGTRVTLATGVGPVAVDLDGVGPGALAWLDAPAVELSAAPDAERIAAALALSTADLDFEVCAASLADVGPRFILVGLATRATLAGLMPDASRLTELLAETATVGVLVVAPAGPGEGDLAARMFFEAGGVREDPATGSAACCLAAVLRAAGRRGRVELTQGVEMLRPSRLRLELDASGDRVGGRVFPVMTGQLTRELVDGMRDTGLDGGPSVASDTRGADGPAPVLSLETPAVEEYLALRRDAGMSPRSRVGAEVGLAASLFAATVRVDGVLVAMGRLVGDGGCNFEVVDVAVAPAFQRRGFGGRIMSALMAYLEANGPEDAYVSLIADDHSPALYARFGFRPTAPRSIGMGLRLGRAVSG